MNKLYGLGITGLSVMIAAIVSGLRLKPYLDAGETYGSLPQPAFAMYGGRKKQQRPGESREAFEKRMAANQRFLDNLKAPYQEAPPGSAFLLVDSPGFSHFSYYDFPNAQALDPTWRATPKQWQRNQRIITDCTLAILDTALYPNRSRPVEELTKRFPELMVEPVGGTKE